ncbi:MAG TPA: sigma-70 family RNA polymerase sigma factor, partial [Marmoricola sp.]|nr:sigma-70 family RNA polymerase sigma factor [Marmoricola sp.]
DASDPELITLVRAGDSAAYEQLFRRHRDVAIRYARRISDSERAEDLCAEAFTKILDLLRRGKGPDIAFRAYLLTTVRTSHLNAIRAGSREDLVPDHEPIGRMMPVIEDPDVRFDRAAICRAFYQLPERWQAALWLTSVEGLPNDEVSLHLGIKANAVASLTFRARAGLRQAYLAEHLLDTADPDCRRVVEQLPGYLRGILTPRRSKQVEQHLSGCARCTAAALELQQVESNLGGLLAPIALGGLGISGAGALLPHETASLKATGTWAKTVLRSVRGVGVTKAAILTSAALLSVAVTSQIVAPHHDHVGGKPDAITTTSVVEDVLHRPVPHHVARRGHRPDSPAPAPSASPGLPSTTSPAPHAAAHPPAPTTSPARPTRGPGGSHHSTPNATPSSSPTATDTPMPPLSLGTLSAVETVADGVHWQQVTVPIVGAVPGTTLVVTATKAARALPNTTPGIGWACSGATMDWHDGTALATARYSCVFSSTGFDTVTFGLQVLSGSTFTATVTPAPGIVDDLTDNVKTLTLRP